MVKKIIIALCVVLSAALALLVWHEKKTEKAAAAVHKEMSAQTRPLSVQVNDLKQQINGLKREASAAQAGTATAQFLVTDLSALSYETVISPLAEYNHPTGLGISLSELPGQDGCLTADEALALGGHGGYFCYAYDAEEAAALLPEASDSSKTADTLTDKEAAQALLLWLDAVDAAASAQGLKMEAAVYFPAGTFRDGFAEALKAHGIQTVIHHGELGAGLLEASEENGLWYAGSAWWRSNSILSSKLSSIIADGGELVTLMGIDNNGTTTLNEWMTRFENIISGQSIEVTDFSAMAKTQAENISRRDRISEETQKQTAKLEAQIEDLETQITEIQNKYMEQIRGLGR